MVTRIHYQSACDTKAFRPGSDANLANFGLNQGRSTL
jgi:hypothetical protein